MAVLAVGITIIFRASDIYISHLEWRHFDQWKLSLLGLDFEMEPWMDSCCSRREASADLDDQNW